MTIIQKQLEKMRHNPRDWRIEQLATIARHYGINIANLEVVMWFLIIHNGSNYYAYLHIRPIKPVYVKKLITLI